VIIRGGRVLSADGRSAVPADVWIEGDRIREVGPGIRVPEGTEVVDATGMLVLPGFVNGHTHSDATLARGMTGSWPVELSNLHNLGTLTDRSLEELRIGAELGAVELLKAGCTSAYDLYGGELDRGMEIAEAVITGQAAAGLRLLAGPCVGDVSSLDTVPGLRERLPAELNARTAILQPPAAAELIRYTERTIERWHGSYGGRVQCAVAPMIPGECSDDLLEGLAGLMHEHGVGMQTHLMETRMQAVAAERRWGRTVTAQLGELGMLGPGSVGAQAVWLTDDDIALLADTGSVAVNAPTSNLRLGSGIAPVREMLDAGVEVALGTDCVLCSDNLNMFEGMRFAALSSTIRFPYHLERWLDANDVWRMTMQGGAAAMGRRGELGEVAPGYLADLCLMRTDSTYLTPLNDPVQQLVFAETGRGVDTVIVAGEIVVRGGECTLIDETDLLRRANEVIGERYERDAEMDALADDLHPHVVECLRETLATPLEMDRFAAGTGAATVK